MTTNTLGKLMFPIAKLRPDPRNLRTHDERNVEAIKASLKKWGWRGVIVARKKDRVVIAGNARLQAAKELGMKQAPVLFVTDTEADGRRYAISDNRTAELATWDAEKLAEQIAGMGDDVEFSGFADDEIEAMAQHEAGDDDDDSDEQEPGDADIFQVRVQFDGALRKRYEAAITAARQRAKGRSDSEIVLAAMCKR